MTIPKVISFLLTLAALITMMPYSSSAQVNMMGYKSVSSSAPVSTALFFVAALMVRYLSIQFAYRKRNFNPKNAKGQKNPGNTKKKK